MKRGKQDSKSRKCDADRVTKEDIELYRRRVHGMISELKFGFQRKHILFHLFLCLSCFVRDVGCSTTLPTLRKCNSDLLNTLKFVKDKCGLASSSQSTNPNGSSVTSQQIAPSIPFLDDKSAKFSLLISSLLSASSSPNVFPLFPSYSLFPHRHLSILVNFVNLLYSPAGSHSSLSFDTFFHFIILLND